MSWKLRLAKDAARYLKRLPRDQRERLVKALNELEEDPRKGDIRPIKSGRFRGALRKRVGRYRIIFSVNTKHQVVDIAAILLRSEKTYR
jgi:mRNA-degrading endonuclease RelE of RelBE toxin-antitoxin system